MKILTKCLIGAVLIAAIATAAKNDRDKPISATPVPPPKEQMEKVVHQLLAQQCVAVTEKNLHDPDSAQLPKATSNDDYPEKFYVGSQKKGWLTVQFEMRAKNGFGGMRLYNVDCQFKQNKEGYSFVKYDSWQKK